MGRKAAEKWKARFGADWKRKRGVLREARAKALAGSMTTVHIDPFNRFIDLELRTDRSFLDNAKLALGVEARSHRQKQSDAALRDAAEVTVGMFKRRGD